MGFKQRHVIQSPLLLWIPSHLCYFVSRKERQGEGAIERGTRCPWTQAQDAPEDRFRCHEHSGVVPNPFTAAAAGVLRAEPVAWVPWRWEDDVVPFDPSAQPNGIPSPLPLPGVVNALLRNPKTRIKWAPQGLFKRRRARSRREETAAMAWARCH